MSNFFRFILFMVFFFFASMLAATDGVSDNSETTVRIKQLSSIEEPEFKEVQIFCKRGIGKVKFAAKELLPGKKLVIFLHLGGLEHFFINTGRISLRISVSSTDKLVRQYLSAGNPYNGLSLSEDAAMSATVRKNSEENYFEIIVPPTFTRFFRNEVELSWIDFYR